MDGVIEDHEGPAPWISNIVLSPKDNGDVRVTIDMREPNKALKRTKQHSDTVKEVRHLLKNAVRFSEMDMSHGYHQIALSEESRDISTFQTHEGLHRFKVLFFGPSPATDLFNQKVKKALKGLRGCISIHDNILVWGDTDEEHIENLEACLQRLFDCGLTLRMPKCNFGKGKVTWFGNQFSKSGMSADPIKIQTIANAGRPLNANETKSFLQACQFNAKFMFQSEEAYASMTKPLRELTHKNRHFQWTDECEQAYIKILEAMTSNAALRPFDSTAKIIMITDASPVGISASLY